MKISLENLCVDIGPLRVKKRLYFFYKVIPLLEKLSKITLISTDIFTPFFFTALATFVCQKFG